MKRQYLFALVALALALTLASCAMFGGGKDEAPKEEPLPDNGPVVRYHDEEADIKKFEGQMTNGMKTGEWTYYNTNGTLQQETTYKDDEHHGMRTVYNEEGAKLYTFTMVEGTREGEGTFFHTSGAIQRQGVYKDNKFEGEWKTYSPDGTVSVIEYFKDGKRNGSYETYTVAGVVKEEGRYIDGMRQGTWKFYGSGTIAAEVPFKDDLTNGLATFYSKVGKTNSITFITNSREGEETFFHENGRVRRQGMNEENVKVGVWNYYNDSGALTHFDTYSNGRKNGPTIVYYHPTKNIRIKGEHANNKRTGVWQYFDRSGTLTDEIEWKGMSAQHVVRYEGGKKTREAGLIMALSEDEIEPSRYHGDYVEYFEDGTTIKVTGGFKNGDRDGEWITYYPGGTQIKEKGEYKIGDKHGYWITYDEAGNETSKVRYLLGKVFE